MEKLLDYIYNIELDPALLKGSISLLVGILLLGLIFRFIFGKKSTLNCAVSSAIGILFVYALCILLRSFGSDYASLIPPLPFISFSGDQLVLFSFSGTDYTVICAQLLSMIILSFLVNIVDGWLPKGKGLFGWIFFRVLTVLLASALHLVSTGLLTTYLPEGIVIYAPPILLCILILMLLTGALKIVVGAVMATVNPLIAALYTFFFANIVGKQISKAVATTAIISGLLIFLHKMGISELSIASAALIAYLPFAVLLIVLWFIVGRLL